ncbi:MAG: hypothetical protein ACR2FF_01200 [Mycobacteriales bacterium]|nr:MAG: hypothetical protein DLM56_00725 [Pseudonocardiales bacterium]
MTNASAADRVLAGGLVAIGVVIVSVVECFLVMFYVGSVPLPIAQLLVVITNTAGPWAMRRLTGRGWAALIAVAAWLVVVLSLTSSGPGGDVVIPGNWQGLTYLVAGMVSALFGMFLTSAGGLGILRRR